MVRHRVVVTSLNALLMRMGSVFAVASMESLGTACPGILKVVNMKKNLAISLNL